MFANTFRQIGGFVWPVRIQKFAPISHRTTFLDGPAKISTNRLPLHRFRNGILDLGYRDRLFLQLRNRRGRFRREKISRSSRFTSAKQSFFFDELVEASSKGSSTDASKLTSDVRDTGPFRIVAHDLEDYFRLPPSSSFVHLWLDSRI
jgi:hypothetical protein